MRKTTMFVASLCIALVVLSIVGMPEVQARGWIINLRKKYTAKLITRITVGPWGPWILVGRRHICVNTLYANIWGRSRVVTKGYWVADRWLAAEVWAWPREWRFFEQWKNLRGPFSYSLVQTELTGPVVTYDFDPLHYDDRYNIGELQQYYEDTIIEFDWTGINDIISQMFPGVRVLWHNSFFDGEPIPDYFSLLLCNYPIGMHELRIEVMYDNGFFRPDFLIIPIEKMPYISLSLVEPVPEVQVMQGGLARVQLRLYNNVPGPEGRVPYFTVERESGGGGGGGAYDTTVWEVDVWDNASYTRPPIPPMTESFFDVFIRANHDAPVGTNETFLVTAHTIGGCERSLTIQARVVPPTFSTALAPTRLIIPKPGGGYPTVRVNGSGWLSGSSINIYFSRTDETPIGSTVVFPNGTFSTEVTIKERQSGIYSLAAVDADGRLAETSLTIASCDTDGDGEIKIYDVVNVCSRYGLVVPLMLPLAFGTVAIAPITAYWLRKKQRSKKQA